MLLNIAAKPIKKVAYVITLLSLISLHIKLLYYLISELIGDGVQENDDEPAIQEK